MQVLDLHISDYDESYSNNGYNGNVDAAFRKIQKNVTAFHIWRVENMNIVSLPRDQYGTFNDGDAYVVYCAYLSGQPAGLETIPREVKSGNLEYHVHFWLGTSTTPEKSGVAAYKTVELDNCIGGNAVQHRETQDNESCRFRSYFKTGFKVLHGSNDSMEVSHAVPRLYRVVGKRCPVVTEVNGIEWRHFNSRNVFLLHTATTLFVWVGRAANTSEKLQSAKAALQMKEEHKTPNLVFVDDGYEQTLPDNDKKEFNKYLSLEKRSIFQAVQEETSEKSKSVIRLYKCSDNNGKYRVAEVKLSPLDQSDLHSNSVFILDHGVHGGIWVWVGKQVPERERSEALRNARGFVKKKKYPNSTRVTRVVEGFEPFEFQVLFVSWTNKEVANGKIKSPATKPQKIALIKFDATFMSERIKLAAETQLVDDGSGTLRIWRVKKTDFVELARERHGTFYSGDCYVVLYSYEIDSKQKHILYYWLGLQASQNDMENAIVKIEKLDEETGKKTVQARVFQENEPAHFLQLFKGKMTILKGKANEYESERNLKNSTYLLRTRGSSSYSSRAVQVPVKANSLNSNYCFVLRRGKRSFIWCGSNSTGDQREMAKGFAGKDFELILEGKEREQFWDYLGGKMQYSKAACSSNSEESRVPRLFYCLKQDNLEVEELLGYTQNDLLSQELMLLDAYNVVFMWIGQLQSRMGHRNLLEIAEEYLLTDPAGRNICMPIFMIKQGHEPPNFKGYFDTWDDKIWQKDGSFEEIRSRMGKSSTNNRFNNVTNNGVGRHQEDEHFDKFEKYPVHILVGPNDKLPTRVNPLNKELYLTHDDFVALFKMKYSDFESLPRWKQQEMKKKVGLF